MIVPIKHGIIPLDGRIVKIGKSVIMIHKINMIRYKKNIFLCIFMGYSFVGFAFICVLYCFLLLGIFVVILSFCVLRKNIRLGGREKERFWKNLGRRIQSK